VEHNNAPQVKRADALDCAVMERVAIGGGGERNGRRRWCLPSVLFGKGVDYNFTSALLNADWCEVFPLSHSHPPVLNCV
jgi:hypothetical protein